MIRRVPKVVTTLGFLAVGGILVASSPGWAGRLVYGVGTVGGLVGVVTLERREARRLKRALLDELGSFGLRPGAGESVEAFLVRVEREAKSSVRLLLDFEVETARAGAVRVIFAEYRAGRL